MTHTRGWLRRGIASADGRALGFLVALVIAFFGTKWATQGIWFFGDLITIAVPFENLFARIQRAGEVPLWAPELHGGYPLLGSGQFGFFYLPHVLLRQFLPGVWVINASLMLHSVLAACGMYLFLRWNKVTPLAAGLSGVLFAFGGTLSGRYEMANVVFAFSWVPLLLALLQRFLERGSPRVLLAWTVASVLHLLVGHPPSVALGLGAEALLLALLLVQQPRSVVRLVPLGIAIVLGLGATLPHLLPILDVLPYTDRADGLSTSELLDFSVPFPAFRGLLFPHPFGHGARYAGPKNEAELAAYLGPPALLLAIVGAVSRQFRYRRLWWLAIFSIVLGVTFSLGAHSPLYRWLVEEGGQRYVAVPERFFLYADLGLVVLAGAGMHIVGERCSSVRFRRALQILLAGGVILPVLWVSWQWYAGVPTEHTRLPELVRLLEKETGPVRLLSRERLSDIAPASNFGVSVWDPVTSDRVYEQTFSSPFDTLEGIAVRLSSPRIAGDGILQLRLLAGTDVIREARLSPQTVADADWNVFSFAPLSRVRGTSLRLALTSTLSRSHAPRLFFHTNPGGEQYDPTGSLSVCERTSCRELRVDGVTADLDFLPIPGTSVTIFPHELLRPHVAAGFGITEVGWIGAFELRRVAEYFQRLGEDREGGLQQTQRSLLNRFPVTHLVGAYPPHRSLPGLEESTEVAALQRGGAFLRVYRNRQALPRIHFARRVLAVPDPSGHLEALERLDPRDQETVVANVEKDAVFSSGGDVTRVEETRTRLTVDTDHHASAFLVVRDVFLPGWHATIDGASAPILTVDSLFRGVVVPPGNHRVEFFYRPRWLRLALAGSSVSIGVLGLWGIGLIISRLVSPLNVFARRSS